MRVNFLEVNIEFYSVWSVELLTVTFQESHKHNSLFALFWFPNNTEHSKIQLDLLWMHIPLEIGYENHSRI